MSDDKKRAGIRALSEEFTRFDQVDKTVDRDQLVGTEIDRLFDLAVHHHVDAPDAVVDVHEAAGLQAVAPDLDFPFAGGFRVDDFTADRGRCLFAAPFPGAVRPVDVVEPCHPRGQAEIFAEVAAHPLRKELLPAVAVLG